MDWLSIASLGLTGEKPASISKSLNLLKILSKVVVENDCALMEVKLEHPSNAVIEMAVSFCGKCTEVSKLQLQKAQQPMVVILDGSVTEAKDEHP